jgi:hypothetical protein
MVEVEKEGAVYTSSSSIRQPKDDKDDNDDGTHHAPSSSLNPKKLRHQN